jgi:hypothetical protein
LPPGASPNRYYFPDVRIMKPQWFSGTSREAVTAVVDNTAPPPDAPPVATSTLVGNAIAIVRPEPNALVRSARDMPARPRSRGTRNAYAKHWAAFSAWCNEQGLCALPAAPQTRALYLAAACTSTGMSWLPATFAVGRWF